MCVVVSHSFRPTAGTTKMIKTSQELDPLLQGFGILQHKYNIYTSSTARGGGGSFKNRKRIREIGCCGSRMTKQKH